MTDLEARIIRSRSLLAGARDYRAYVGPPAQYDFMGATQFRLLTALGLREDHSLVDIGCGSLRAGKLLIQYLMPGRYIGVEPNEWLWKDALEHEVGWDLVALKRPVFSASDDFGLGEVADASMDFAVAQSIYSHCGQDLLDRSLAAVARVIEPSGRFLFTAVTPGAQGHGAMQAGRDVTGWVYPACVVYEPAAIARACRQAGLHVQKLEWFHPRQTWFHAVRDPALLLTPQSEAELGTGQPLFDSRFA